MKTDILIIGGGIAGCVAALAAASRGQSATLVSYKPGASFMHSGIFDLDADPGRVPDISLHDSNSLGRNLELLAISDPLHPYAVLGGRNAEEKVREAFTFFLDALHSGGVETTRSFYERMLLAGNLGTVRRARFALSRLASGDLRVPSDMKVCFVGIDCLSDFNSGFVASLLPVIVKRATEKKFSAVSHANVTLPCIQGHSNITTYQIADMLDDDPELEKVFASSVRGVLHKGTTHIAFPAVLGIKRNNEIIKAIESETGAKVFEIATTPPSVPGRAISEALSSALKSAGVTVLPGKVIEANKRGNAISSVRVESRRGDILEIETGRIVLATGKFIGGGIEHGDSIRETTLGLPVWNGNLPISNNAVVMELLTAKIGDRQPLFSCGVKTDSQLRPLDSKGKPAYDNVFCAGSILSGYDPFRGRCGTGVAVVTGFIAGSQ